jgi:hypothetical protein
MGFATSFPVGRGTEVNEWIVGDTEVTESLPVVRSGVARFTGSLACTPQ